jgi:aminopeptidase-like protein
VPDEWNIRDAYIKNSRGERIVDFRATNLHVMSYSIPVHEQIRLDELRKHIFTLPDQPSLVPYRTSYYARAWAFCMSHDQFCELPNDTYEVMIDSDLKPGSLTIGEAVHKGESDEEVLLSAHVCHPSLANDNCSGIALLACLAYLICQKKTRYTYRFLFAPASIGAIAWLDHNFDRTQRIKHGLVVSCVGDGGGPTYKRSRQGDSMIDRAIVHVLSHNFANPSFLDYFPYGYDERHYCSPGFNLPVGLFQRSQFGSFPEYHTSADNLGFIRPEHLASSFHTIWEALEIVETSRRLMNTRPYGEPQLGRRGLYTSVGGDKSSSAQNMAKLWVLNLSDGQQTLLDIAERSNLPFSVICEAAQILEQSGLLVECDSELAQL